MAATAARIQALRIVSDLCVECGLEAMPLSGMHAAARSATSIRAAAPD
ncbi:hypothetical protein [Achromobacter aloeverae]